MREIQRHQNFDTFDRIYNQLEKMDFSNFICSPLINGGCGMGKTTALTDPRMYELFARKLNKKEPQILFIESRSATRDQLRQKNENPNYYFLQFARASQVNLSLYDIIIIDEAHSLFMDASFSANQVEPLARWLREAKCFQIFITASDVEFLGFANSYFNEREFSLTFPDLENIHMKFLAEQMILSINTKKVSEVIRIKKDMFFKENAKGIFFLLSVKDAYECYQYYTTEKKKKCGFYISQQNNTKIRKKDKREIEENSTLSSYMNPIIEVDALDFYHFEEQKRINNGLPTVREELLAGRFPQDVDYLFITDTGREGLDINEGKLDFVFIEDSFPLTINQKIYRYRGNLPFVYVNLPQRKIEKMIENELREAEKLMKGDESFLAGYYEGSGGKTRIVLKNPQTGKYEVSQLYLSTLLYYARTLNEVLANKDNPQFLKLLYGTQVNSFQLEVLTETARKEIIENFFAGREGEILTEEKKKDYIEQLKTLGLSNEKYEKDFSFPYIMKLCKQYSVCDFKRHKATKKEVAENPELIYRKEYLQIKKI